MSTSDSTVATVMAALPVRVIVTSEEVALKGSVVPGCVKITPVMKNNCIFWQKDAEK